MKQQDQEMSINSSEIFNGIEKDKNGFNNECVHVNKVLPKMF